MKCDKRSMLLYAVTDRAWTGRQSLYEQVESALKGGATCIQLREKDLSEEEFLAEAYEISDLCRRYSVPFIVNDNVDIAVACRADGVHVGQEDMEAAQVRRRVGAGAVFSTSTKTDADILPIETLREICAAVDLPVVAIGGIGRGNISQLAGTGIDGVALVSAVFAADDIEKECRILRRLSEETVNK